ncbi:AAA family ATPase [Saccharopolyspora spinosporotrichia]
MVDVEPGPVLYLALEDTPRRLKTRMGKLLGDEPAPRNLSLATSCPTLPAGGDEAIAAWLDQNPDARMVVLDVFAKMRGTPPAGMSAYDADYAAIGRAKQLADRYGVAFVLVHHVRKMGSRTSSSGLRFQRHRGRRDATLRAPQKPRKADGVLQVTGRDIDEAEYALAFHPNSGAWQLLEGPATDHSTTPAPPSSATSAKAQATGRLLSRGPRESSCRR